MEARQQPTSPTGGFLMTDAKIEIWVGVDKGLRDQTVDRLTDKFSDDIEAYLDMMLDGLKNLINKEYGQKIPGLYVDIEVG